ncbi:MAG: DUF2029 domain-containing protein [Thermoplasmata archaeon]|nr:DUF2029 domain-containing protein [Thermoplasmata archaeon]
MKSNIFNLRNALILAGVSCQLVLYASLLAYMFANLDARIKNIDYLVIYSGGYILHYESPTRLYDLDLQHRVQEMVLSVDQLSKFYPYNHPHILAHILGWVTTSNYTASYLRWVLVLVIFYLVGLTLLLRLLYTLQWQAGDLWLFGISGLLFYPVFVSYLKGQDSAFLLLGISLWTFGLFTGRDRLAGIGLALTVIRPQVALLLALPFLFNRRKVWWWFVLGGLVLLLYSYLLIGAQGLMDFFNVLLLSGQGFGFDADVMINLKGAALRLFPAIDGLTLNIITYGGYALAILFLCIMWAKTRTVEFKHIGLAILFSMIFSPHMHSHDWSLLLIPSLTAAIVLSEQKILSRKYAVLLPLGVSIYLMVFNAFVQSNLAIYILILGLGVLLWFPDLLKRSQRKLLKC